MTAWGWIRRVGPVAVSLGLLEYLVVPQLLEASSRLAYTSLTQAVISTDAQLRAAGGVATLAALTSDDAGSGGDHLGSATTSPVGQGPKSLPDVSAPA